MPAGKDIVSFVASVTATAGRIATPVEGARRSAGGKVRLKAAVANSTGIIYVGGSNVTTSNGYPLAVISSAGESIEYEVDDPSRIWAVSSSGTLSLHVSYA